MTVNIVSKRHCVIYTDFAVSGGPWFLRTQEYPADLKLLLKQLLKKFLVTARYLMVNQEVASSENCKRCPGIKAYYNVASHCERQRRNARTKTPEALSVLLPLDSDSKIRNIFKFVKGNRSKENLRVSLKCRFWVSCGAEPAGLVGCWKTEQSLLEGQWNWKHGKCHDMLSCWKTVQEITGWIGQRRPICVCSVYQRIYWSAALPCRSLRDEGGYIKMCSINMGILKIQFATAKLA